VLSKVCGDEEGAYRVLDAASLDIIHKAQDSRAWIEEIKFSPNGKNLVIASHDCKMYIYDTENSYKQLGVFSGHTSHITHLDFDIKSEAMQSTCGGSELLFWDVAECEQNQTGPTALRDVEWDSWTCPLGWPVQGIWPSRPDGTEYNAVDRAHNHPLIATADELGRVKLFNYPCIVKGDGSDDYLGHSSHVTNCRWVMDDSCLITTGGDDLAVFQWRLNSHNPLQKHEMDEVTKESPTNPAEKPDLQVIIINNNKGTPPLCSFHVYTLLYCLCCAAVLRQL
jgi:microtubule-associated protein-like 6